MKNVSIPVPSLGNFAPAAAPPFDIRTIDPTSMLTKLSMDLLPSDQLTVSGTLDVTAGPFSPNNTILGTVRGNNGQPASGDFLSFWPYLFIQRTAGQTPTGPSSLFYVSSSTAIGSPTAPVSLALPRLNSNPGSTVIAPASTTAVVLPDTTIVAQTTAVTVAGTLPLPIIDVIDTTGFSPTGLIEFSTSALVSYTGLTPTSFTGCSGGLGNIAVGDSVTQAQFVQFAPPVDITNVDTTGFPPTGVLLDLTTPGNPPITYTGITPTSFTGCTTPGFATLTNDTLYPETLLPQPIINVVSTAGFVPVGSFSIPSIGATVNYTGITPTSFTGCTTLSVSPLAPGQAVVASLVLPLSIINVGSTSGFTPTGSIFIPAIDATITYTGLTPTSFTGCTTTSTATLVPGQVVNQVVTSALLNLAPFGNPVRVGLSANQTVLDTFNLYGTDDPSVVSTAGGTLLFNLQGGGGQNSNTLVSAYQYVYVIRTGGFTVGSLFAWGADDPGVSGALNVGSLTVGDTAVNGNIGTPPLTAPQSVDIFSSFVLTQGTPGITATLPMPTSPTPGRIAFVSNSSTATAAITMYGVTITPGSGATFQWDGIEWISV